MDSTVHKAEYWSKINPTVKHYLQLTLPQQNHFKTRKTLRTKWQL